MTPMCTSARNVSRSCLVMISDIFFLRVQGIQTFQIPSRHRSACATLITVTSDLGLSYPTSYLFRSVLAQVRPVYFNLPRDVKLASASASTNPSFLGAKIPASYQEDRSPQKILCPGRMPGSESREPAGINNFLPLLLRNGRPDPHSAQKTLVNRRSPG